MKITYKGKESKKWDKFDVLVLLKGLGYQTTSREESQNGLSIVTLASLLGQMVAPQSSEKAEEREYLEHEDWDSNYKPLVALNDSQVLSSTGSLKYQDIKNEAQLLKFLEIEN